MYYPIRQIALSGSRGPFQMTVLLADTTSRKLRGLTGPLGLGRARGMYFTWQREGKRTLHMRGVRVRLDALFFDSDGFLSKAVRMEPEISIYGATAQTVLEVPSSYDIVAKYGLRIGRSRVALLDQVGDGSYVFRAS